MTPLLIDTHVLVWLLIDPERIPEPTLLRLRDASTALAVSAASAWEIATKVRLGKLGEAEPLVHGYHAHLQRLRVDEVPIEGRHALTAGLLRWEHRDPFDRMIVAQAMAGGVPVVTADRVITAFPGVATVWG